MKKINAFFAALALGLISASAMAETSTLIDGAEVAGTISDAMGPVGVVGAAILGVLAAIMGFRLIRGLMGR